MYIENKIVWYSVQFFTSYIIYNLFRLCCMLFFHCNFKYTKSTKYL